MNFNHQLEIRVKERMQEVYENEKKYRHLFDNNPMPMWVMDLDTFEFLDVNEAAIVHYGYSREIFLSMTSLDIRPDDEKERFKKEDHSASIKPSDGNRGRWKHIKSDGTVIHVEITAHNIIFEGRKTRLVMSKDITEKLKAEERLIASEARFRSIIEQFPYPVINYAPDGSCIGANESWETMWQDKRENVKGYNILHDRQMMDSVLYGYVKKAFEGEISVSEPYLYDPAQIGQKGRKRWMVMTFFPLKNSDDGLLEVILILQDITERKSDEEKIVM
ncbi:MAG TPA: PAS domain S-box protein, partial [Panacibacter sp.]|nr:PAS domain S-box protein [Panacibacter sp.]